jgi:hypothetical protein
MPDSALIVGASGIVGRNLAEHLEKQNIAVNSTLVRNLLHAVAPGQSVQHVALVTGLKHYLGPFEAYGQGALPPTPFREEQGRLAVDAGPLWSDLARKYHLAEPNLTRLASPWHTDADLGRPMEVLTDMSRSRKLGFLEYESTRDSFINLFNRMREARLIP